MMKQKVNPPLPAAISDFVAQVKHNCNISDAKFWGYYSICGLLMRYRELYRQEHSLRPWDDIDSKEIGCWIQERETLWRTGEDQELQQLVIHGRTYDPFDVNGLNAELEGSGLVYGSGYGAFNKPTFFVAVLDAAKDYYDYRVLTVGRELCRDIAATLAMLQGRCIYLRREVIEQFLWDRFQDMRSNPYCGSSAMMFSQYGIAGTDEVSPRLYEKIGGLAVDAAEVFVMHEVGEAYEDTCDDDWREMLTEGCDKATELFLRGIKDIRADTSLYGPLKSIIREQNLPRLSIFVACMDGIRREVFPEMRVAMQQFRESDDWSLFEDARRAGYERTERLQNELVRLWRQHHDVAVLARYIRDAFPRPGGRSGDG